MNLNKWVILFLTFIIGDITALVIADGLKTYNEKDWYNNKNNWIIAALCFIFPVFIMFFVFLIHMTVKNAVKLNIKGKQIYNSPYFWLLSIIIPIIGWISLFIMYLYIKITTIIKIFKLEKQVMLCN